MDKLQSNVKEFMTLAGQAVRTKPTTNISPADVILRCRLILEEALEFCDASGVSILIDGFGPINKDNFSFIKDKDIDLVKVVDGIGDLKYVADGAANTYGVDMERIEEIIHSANMNKFSGDAHKDEHGKWIKPSNWQAPEPLISEELVNQGYGS